MSVGHLARLLEAAGIPTVVIGIQAFRPLVEGMTLPRLVITHNLLGRTLGAPGDPERQREVVLAALHILENAEKAGTLEELPEPYRVGRPIAR